MNDPNPANLEACYLGLGRRGLLPPGVGRTEFWDTVRYWGVRPDQVKRAASDQVELEKLGSLVFRERQSCLTS